MLIIRHKKGEPEYAPLTYFCDPLGARHRRQSLDTFRFKNPWVRAPTKKEVNDLFLVIRLGLEPKTPTLKVLCSTN